jgi:hypothetical protein
MRFVEAKTAWEWIVEEGEAGCEAGYEAAQLTG